MFYPSTFSHYISCFEFSLTFINQVSQYTSPIVVGADPVNHTEEHEQVARKRDYYPTGFRPYKPQVENLLH